MKKLGMIIAVIIVVLLLVGCSTATQEPAADTSGDTVVAEDTPEEAAAPEMAEGEKTFADLTVGYAQIGAESEWRTANTASIKEEADKLGVTLKFSDAQQKQENQIAAMRSYIAEGVDVIGFSPVVETGWETVMQEAKDAGIPVIMVDRRADVPRELYATYLGSDFVEEGKKAGDEMNNLLPDGGKIVELVGTVGSAPANDRYSGFRETLNDNIEIIDSQSGDFTRAKGKEVMEAFLKNYGDEITGLYAHNDDMAIGAIQAIEEYGLNPGTDIKIVSIDAVRGAFEAMIDGKLNVTVECNPLLGPQFYDLALRAVNGEELPEWVPSEESVYYPDNAAELLPERQY
ncbi:MAG: ABC transporter substrate-binding protein [Candidatus Promineifilaceae bacterium]|jgi:ABC-type sugar transport system substrate-binding protein